MDYRLPADFRKLTIRERREMLARIYELTPQQLDGSGHEEELLDLADVMVESAAGFVPLPLGVAGGVLIDGREYNIPMATEEPSVIAAATYGAKLIARSGGFTTSIDQPIMTAQVFLEDVPADRAAAVCGGASPDAPAAPKELDALLRSAIDTMLPGMTARGGGYRGCDAALLPETGLLRIQLHIDVRDAMGANILNTAAEGVKPLLQEYCGGRGFMAILTNDAAYRHARAEFRMPLKSLRRRGIDSSTLAERIVRASELAQEDSSRAVTHNKGIMNGVTALAIATGNDTRGLEAAVHRYAARDGRYRGISHYRIEDDALVGSIELPVPLGSVGGAIGFHPVADMAFRILDISSASELGRVAAALGLAQNFAAVSALVSEGIQHGHMRFHAHRLAYQAGARDTEIAPVAAGITETGIFNLETANRVLQQLRSAGPGSSEAAE
ncbi:hydroxymethylglutaryl-CoA reductase, degradative [Spirochaeta africana]|uniref:3-hydroxy-3-methylglutaryl coenzyme A reductase n=1 Tax=Spirochaeta africana (strain ATCC 700263 / DSM 8902 / Z-7692) TaxID=889378 RepID=H9UG37_SPIAZ|nr:hydroxymethylglutaryl-CoA reductase, degradative [Spirochaeta africana]AFG36480.1 hydroxymethylglutaryl-CoA reductase, degradative [Spirochaeta africana DSM 8902]